MSVASGGATTSLTWDGESRLKTATVGGSTTTYSYNGIGQRISKTGATSNAYVLADDSIDRQVLADGNASYSHGANGLVLESRGGTSKFYHTDALGSVRALTNSSGSVTDTKSTDAFGLVVSSSGSTPTPFGFAGNHGYQQDSETGLTRLGHRMYDASTGRFLSRDPIRDGYNWYAYCDNDPANAVDPEGLETIEVTLPANPSGLGPNWQPDPSHREPNGERWVLPGGGGLDFHPARPGMGGHQEKDHWHVVNPPKHPGVPGRAGKPQREDGWHEPGDKVEITVPKWWVEPPLRDLTTDLVLPLLPIPAIIRIIDQ